MKRALLCLSLLQACAAEPAPQPDWGQHICNTDTAPFDESALSDVGAETLCEQRRAVRLERLTLTHDLAPDDLDCICEVNSLVVSEGTRFEGLVHTKIDGVVVARLPGLELLRLGGSPAQVSIVEVPDTAVIEFPNAMEPPSVLIDRASPSHLNGLVSMRTLGNVQLFNPTPGRIDEPLNVQGLFITDATWDSDLGCVRPQTLEITGGDAPRFACDLDLVDLKLTSVEHIDNLDNVDADSIMIRSVSGVSDLGDLPAASPNTLLLLDMSDLESLDGLADLSGLERLHLSSLPALTTLPALPALSTLQADRVGLQDLGSPSTQRSMLDLRISNALSLRNIDALASVEEIEQLYLSDVQVADASGLDGLRRVGSITLHGNLPPIAANLEEARQVEIRARYDGRLHFWPALREVESLRLDGLTNLHDVAPLVGLRRAGSVVFRTNPWLTDLSGLHDLESVETLSFSRNSRLSQEEIDALVEQIEHVGQVSME